VDDDGGGHVERKNKRYCAGYPHAGNYRSRIIKSKEVVRRGTSV